MPVQQWPQAPTPLDILLAPVREMLCVDQPTEPPFVDPKTDQESLDFWDSLTVEEQEEAREYVENLREEINNRPQPDWVND